MGAYMAQWLWRSEDSSADFSLFTFMWAPGSTLRSRGSYGRLNHLCGLQPISDVKEICLSPMVISSSCQLSQEESATHPVLRIS